MDLNIARVEDRLLVISRAVGAPVYDFDFDLHFACTHPIQFRSAELCVLRIGAVRSYEAEYAEKRDWGLRIVNSPEEHFRASEIEGWLPLIVDLTPATQIYDSLPPPAAIENEFDWPVFVKGSRQTAKHNPALCVARNPAEYMQLRDAYLNDPILGWQRPVVREFVELEPVAGNVPNKFAPHGNFAHFGGLENWSGAANTGINCPHMGPMIWMSGLRWHTMQLSVSRCLFW